jgi:hypothetical protein
MELRWERIRDEETTEVYHKMYDAVIQKYVAVIHKATKGYRVQIKENVPWTRRTLKSAKKDCEFVYINCK